MKLDRIVKSLQGKFKGLVVINTWGETSLFYNPHGILKRGAYCFTLKASDGQHDASSRLDRDEATYRLNFKIGKAKFLATFKEPALPERPKQGGVISLKSGKPYDPTVLDTLIPHPVYGWMSWVSVINPSEETFQSLIERRLLQASYDDAVQRHDKNPLVMKHHAARSGTKRKRRASDVLTTRGAPRLKAESKPQAEDAGPSPSPGSGARR